MSADEHPITCEEAIAHLIAFLDGELDARVASDIDRHLARCRECFSRAEFEQRLRARVRATGTQPAPERLRRRIERMLDDF